jgi:hypothetical protein
MSEIWIVSSDEDISPQNQDDELPLDSQESFAAHFNTNLNSNFNDIIDLSDSSIELNIPLIKTSKRLTVKDVNITENNNNHEEMIVMLSGSWNIDLIDSLKSNGYSVDLSNSTVKSSTWVRCVKNIYDFNQKTWSPTNREYQMENYILILFECTELVKLITENKLTHIIQEFVDKNQNYSLILLIQDIIIYAKEQQKLQNQRIKCLLNNQQMALPLSLSKTDLNKILIDIQIKYNLKIHYCTKNDLNDWMVGLTHQIQSAPIKYTKSAQGLGISFEQKIKSGKDVKDTWKQMLMQIPGVSNVCAESIIQIYPTFSSLLKMYRNNADVAPCRLFECNVPANGKKIGGVVANRIVDALFTRNPNKMVQ